MLDKNQSVLRLASRRVAEQAIQWKIGEIAVVGPSDELKTLALVWVGQAGREAVRQRVNRLLSIRNSQSIRDDLLLTMPQVPLPPSNRRVSE